MRRILTALASALALVLAVPGLALARHHHSRGAHHRGHHGRHLAKGARLIRFAPAGEGKEGSEGTAGTTTSPSAEAIGTVQSYEGEVLTIKLNDGTLISGKVTEQTRVCVIAPPAPSGEGQKEGSEDDEQRSDGGDSWDGGPEGSSGGQPPQEAGAQGDEGSWSGEGDSSASGEGSTGGDHGCCESSTSVTSALVAGATVREAELRLTSSGSTWESVIVQ